MRIIPARAGFTSTNYNPAGMPTDHPRSRGVYVPGSSFCVIMGGSSPLARGLLHDEDGAGGGGGIIPARAGFTGCRRGREGERRGSSPLARGLPWAHESDFDAAGIIPARAGFTASPPT